ncbi:MAG: response regulator [Bdellovibrionales bacterium]|nr:response regulator [Oligoflexia bacterium]
MVQDTIQTRKTILLVEEDEALRNSLEFLLELSDLNYLSASNGEDAVQILSTSSIDIIITDFQMPKMNGIELLKWCRSRQVHIPVIFISANVDLMKEEEIALEDCCATLMEKPLNLEIFEEAIYSAMLKIHHPNCVHSSNH